MNKKGAMVIPSTFGLALPVSAEMERKCREIYLNQYQLSHEEVVELSQGVMPKGLIEWQKKNS